MRWHRNEIILLGVTALLRVAAPALGAERPARYLARLANGQRIESDRLTNWYAASAVPQLGGAPLLDPANPFLWLRNRARRMAEESQSFVEFTNGDRLPGTVVDYRSGNEERYHPQPPHLIVRVSLGFEPPDNKAVSEIRVAMQFVRRIVWQHRKDAAGQGPAALYRDGRSLAVRAVRLKSGEAHVLTAEGDRQLDWDELAELHFPLSDLWTAWFDQLAAVCPTADTRLLQVETSTGLIATASLACFAARFEGNSADPDRWVHGLQPAWSLDILWIPLRDIVTYRSFASHEIPLSRIALQRVGHGAGLDRRRNVQIDRNVLGGPLRSGALDFGWGFGVMGGTELVFELPAAARSLRTSVCLDRAAGSGGCIRPRIYFENSGDKPLWEGPVLIGSERAIDSGPITLERTAEPRKVIFQIDAANAGRPAGADPLDIRDYADWCDPLVEFETTFVQHQLDKRLSSRFLAWHDWKLEIDGQTSSQAGIEFSLHQNDAIPGTFEPAIRNLRQPLTLRRDMPVGPGDNWLVIAATRASRRLLEPKLEVRIDGEVAGEFVIPVGGGDLKDVTPLVVPLGNYRKAERRSLAVEIRQQGAKDASPVQYWAIAVARQIPTLHELLEDDAAPRAIDAEQTGSATIAADRHYSGRRSLRLTPSGRYRIELSEAIPVRATPTWGEGRFLRLAVRKTGGGRVALELEDSKPREEPARYDLGVGDPSYGKAVRIWQDRLPDDWIVVTRDLFADFGPMDVKALVVACPDGEEALVDHVYLARSRADFDLAAPRENINPKRQ